MASLRRVVELSTIAWIAIAVLAPEPAAAQIAQERVDLAVMQRIRDEGFSRSYIADLARVLTDEIGPRLTGSPGLRKAHEWTAGKFREWGLAKVEVEPWGEFGRGWENVSYSGRFLTPFFQPLLGIPQAWTGSTRGVVTGPAVIVRADRPEDLMHYRGKLRNAFLLLEPPVEIPPEFEPHALRRPLDVLFGPFELYEKERNWELELRGGQILAERSRQQELRTALLRLLPDEGIAAILMPSSRAFGILRVGGSAVGRDSKNPIPLPELVISHEQYGRIWRAAGRGIPVNLEINIQNRFDGQDLSAYNTVADIPGTDRSAEYVILGAHLDSWHPGTGATDNGAGSLVMMEAVRIIKALGLTPRRTIRVALWSGEEQGLLGSRGWVRRHQDLWPAISAYVNLDNGTGKIRGIWNQSNAAATPVFEQILWPFRDLGVVVVRPGDTGGTDHLAFDEVGIPGFNFMQDPIESEIRAHHTIADTYERLMIEDLEQAAVIVAAVVYDLAMRDEMMPRKPAPAK
ncbi:MAG: M20/M25/M40 family metallo-hydrolase [Gemmatimonadota bacterium]